MLSIPVLACVVTVVWTSVRLVKTKGADTLPWVIACLGSAFLLG